MFTTISSFGLPIFVTFISASLIYLFTRMLLGERANRLPGGALAPVFIQAATYTSAQTGFALWLFMLQLLVMLASALAGHYLTVLLVTKQLGKTPK